MEIVNLLSNSLEWEKFREGCYPASEAPAAMGVSKFMPKTPEDLALIRVGAKVKEVTDYQQKKIFDPGHEHEFYARFLAEKIVGKEFSPVTGKIKVTDLLMDLSASYDGLSFDGDDIFEHKMWNEQLGKDVKNKNLDPHYFWQLEQQLLVSKAKRVIFVTSDAFRVDDKEVAEELMAEGVMVSDEIVSFDENEANFYVAAYNFEYMYYEPVFGRDKALVEGWKRYEDVVSKVINNDPSWKSAAIKIKPKLQKIIELKKQVKSLEEEVKPIKDALVASVKLSGIKKTIGEGIEVVQRQRKGVFDEEKLKASLGVDSLDDFRKPNSISWGVKAVVVDLTEAQKVEVKQKQDKQGGKHSVKRPVHIVNDRSVVGRFAF